MVRADRLVSLVLMLQARGRMTARDLAGELGVSVRTIYRDLAGLSASWPRRSAGAGSWSCGTGAAPVTATRRHARWRRWAW